MAAFTGAGISVESGIPPFRGDDGIWSKYDPAILELSTYLEKPKTVWPVIRELFFKYFGTAKPNNAHLALASMEQKGLLKGIITQNIDNLHQEAGSTDVAEFHGNSKTFICTHNTSHVVSVGEVDFDRDYPHCPKCNHLTKPSFIFFGEAIPREAFIKSEKHAQECDVMLIVGSTGEVVPASNIPWMAKRNGATIIEVNPQPTTFTYNISDISLKGKAGEVLAQLDALL
ncbi:NAD-dependent protein deacetylase [Salinivirga cyanobacteriivorans]|uniref:protein acetyllysine N-acetyltransferase n=1 Tax=Salinivirga cyanobacteriivorans TaxID=1307839 RepID=A0A0S2HWK6_9BACT|nr:Sir2 family NAD-dependent protein deacetylase [Salinivirga cyanobacteriivorans]ALO14399.1 NAD-dependent protein deacetylase [Salinivirga cyanobacteriivorans]